VRAVIGLEHRLAQADRGDRSDETARPGIDVPEQRGTRGRAVGDPEFAALGPVIGAEYRDPFAEHGQVDVATARFQPLCFLPGFARGLAFAGGHALVGLSLPRSSPTFAGLPLEDRLAAEKLPAQCAVAVVNLSTGQPEHALRLGGIVRELYDIAVLPGVRKPMLIGTQAGSALNKLVMRGADVPLSTLA
jgi:hypothetical protein